VHKGTRGSIARPKVGYFPEGLKERDMTNKSSVRHPAPTAKRTVFCASPGMNCWFCQNRPLTRAFAVRAEHTEVVFLFGICSLACAAAIVEESSDYSPIVVSEDELRDLIEQQRPTVIQGLRVGPLIMVEIPSNLRKSESGEPIANRGEGSG
jgi:hypothetical protein